MNNKKKNDFFLDYMKNQQEKQTKIESASANNGKPANNSIRYRMVYFFETLLDLINKILFALLSTKKSISLLALLLAISFYATIHDSNSTRTESERVSDVEVKVVNLSDDYIVDGVPETVYTYLDGTGVQIQLALIRGFNVYCDLQNLTEGIYDRIPLHVSNIYGGAETTVIPETISIHIYKKEMKEFDLGYHFLNEDRLQDIVVEKPNLNMSKIKVYGKASDLEKVAKVECVMDLLGVTSSTSSLNGVFKAYDAFDNEITTVLFDQESMSVPIQTAKAKKEIQIRPLFIGLSEKYSVSSITTSTPIYYYGDPKTLEKYNEIKVDINLNEMDSNYIVKDISIVAPDDVDCSETKITVMLSFDTRNTRTFTSVPIQIKGLENEKYQLSENTAVVKLTGALSRLNQITLDDIEVFANVTDVTTKEQTLDLSVKCADPLIQVELEQENQVKIKITGE